MSEINLEKAREEFWLWIGERLDRKREEREKNRESPSSHVLKTEIVETQVVCDRFAELFGYPYGR